MPNDARLLLLDKKQVEALLVPDDVTIGNPKVHRKLRIDQCVDFDSRKMLAYRCQTRIETQIAGQSLDNEFGHVRYH
jgi:hypothetical protein